MKNISTAATWSGGIYGTLKDSKKPPPPPPLPFSIFSSSPPKPIMDWLFTCSSSYRVSNKAERVRSCWQLESDFPVAEICLYYFLWSTFLLEQKTLNMGEHVLLVYLNSLQTLPDSYKVVEIQSTQIYQMSPTHLCFEAPHLWSQQHDWHLYSSHVLQA